MNPPSSIHSTSSSISHPLSLLQRNKKEHDASDWEAIRPRFKELYIEENRRLAEVSAVLRDEHGFHATDKQYKDRARKWGLRKNFKTSEMQEAIAAGVAAEDLNDSAVVRHNGNEIPEKRLRRFARDGKLQYIPPQRALTATAATRHSPRIIGAVPQMPTFDIVIELPRSMLIAGASAAALGPRGVHSALASLDRMIKVQYPVLDFSVLGVSDAAVHYGLNYRQRSRSGVITQRMPLAAHDAVEDTEKRLELRFVTPWQVLEQYDDMSRNQPLRELLSSVFRHLFRRCHQRFWPGYRNTVEEPRAIPRGADTEPPVRCLAFRPTPGTARNMYLQLLAHGAVVGAAMTSLRGVSHIDVTRQLIGARNPQVVTDELGNVYITDTGLDVVARIDIDVDVDKNTLSGMVGVPLDPSRPSSPRYSQQQLRQRLREPASPSTDSGAPALLENNSIAPAQDLFLLDGDDMLQFIDPEFRAAARRAAGRPLGGNAT